MHTFRFILIFISLYTLSFSAFSQTSPSQSRSVAKPIDGQLSESGHFQERNNDHRNRSNSPDSNKDLHKNIDLNTKNHTPKSSGSQLHSPPGVDY